MIQPGQERLASQPARGRRSRLRGDMGSTLVETALSITILLVLVIGIMDACLMVYSYHFISNAAREGTRYAIVRGDTWIQAPWGDGSTPHPCGSTSTSYKNAGCTASAQNIEDYVKSLTFPGIDTSQLQVSSTWYSVPGGTADPGYNAAGDWVQVKVSYNFATFVPFIPSRFLTMSSTSQMLITQ